MKNIKNQLTMLFFAGTFFLSPSCSNSNAENKNSKENKVAVTTVSAEKESEAKPTETPKIAGELNEAKEVGQAVFIVVTGSGSSKTEEALAVAINLDNLGANILVLPQAASVDNYYAADIDAPTFPKSYVEKLVTSTLPGVDNLSPKLTRRVEVNGQKIVLTGILPKSEIASKPIWQQGGIVGEQVAASCAPTGHKKYADEKLQRKGIDTLAVNDCFVGSAIAQRMKLNQKKILHADQKKCVNT